MTTVLSISLVRTDVTEMGRKSACLVGAGVLGTGRIIACFHCRGTVPVEIDAGSVMT